VPKEPASRLATYRAKRDPKRTPEPMASSSPPTDHDPIFVIQEHHARALHWDFRLERDGALVSWALPKGLPVDPKVNHLAVHVEDHPFDYKDFEGEIPKGEYGAGLVRIWDRGTYETEKWRPNEVMVVLHGERTNGRFVLFPTGSPEDKDWMIHRMDDAPPDFVPFPKRIEPMLATSGTLPRRSDGWAYEFKWDGVRAIVYVDGGRVRALSRNGKDLLTSFPELRQLGSFLGSTSAVLDGEIVALDETGRPDFGKLQRRLHVASSSTAAKRAKESPVSYLVFDVLYLVGRSTVELSYDERRHLLEALQLAGDTFATPPSFSDVPGRDLLAVSLERGLEGVVAKRRDSPYTPGQRTSQWIKVKNVRTQEAVIGGWTEGRGELAGTLGAVLLGIHDGDGLTYVGKVGTGFSDQARAELLTDLQGLAQDDSPFTSVLSRSETALAHFVRPVLVGEVQYTEWTHDGHLRHPSWRGLRADKEPREVVREP
ncbi:MAG TPA: non-homologous end-joining DNA ligase, partial [Acidimicrobiales bacterium]|nr:non-homologous end-joining DNA ligase [Acidimicrobiales bacterium]